MIRLLLAIVLCLDFGTSLLAQTVPPQVLAAETHRAEVIERISRSTVAIFDSTGQGGGSGVVISSDGYALTNFHVTAPCGAAMKCGLNDGNLYDAVLVGLDPPGDVGLIKLLGRDDFPAAQLGNSDNSRVGDQVFVVGNPFLLAEDYQPTVTYGILSGTHRYQYPAGTLLEYADCLQTDASINPGNSGGPMFDAEGRLIGINGRGSFEKRGRVNVGVGYAISINQIKRFLSHLKSGRVVDHATLGATVMTTGDGRVVVDDLLDDCDAYRRGLRYGDYLLRFGDRDVATANEFKNALGTYPAAWRVPIEYVRDGMVAATVVRLESLHGVGELESLIEQEGSKPVPIEPPGPKDDDNGEPKLPDIPKLLGGGKPPLPPAVTEVYEERSGFANYFFNRQQQQRLVDICPQWSAFDPDRQLEIAGTDSLDHPVRSESTATKGSLRSVRGQFFAAFDDPAVLPDGPPGSGGLMAAVHRWRKLLAVGLEAFDEAYYFGQLPFGPQLQMLDCLVVVDGGLPTHFYFEPASGQLVALEHFSADDCDPCQIRFSNFRKWESAELPFTWKVRFGDNAYLEFDVDEYQQPVSEASGDE